MKRNLALFLATFVLGAVVALVTRAALLDPHAGRTPAAPATPAAGAMVSNALTAPTAAAKVPPAAPARDAAPAHPQAQPAANDAHAGHAPDSAATPGQPVNTVCAICGMPVDPKVPFSQYQGKTIGFGCKMCRPKFEADPDRYGPAYLRNEVL